MAIYRNVQLSFWTDNKVADEFTPEDKYFYLYLLTNPQTNLCGCYEISYKQISNHTGYNEDTINRLLERFEKYHNVIKYCKETKEVLILNWCKYNWSRSEKTLVGVENAAKHIKCGGFREYVTRAVDSIRNGTEIFPLKSRDDNADGSTYSFAEPAADKKKRKTSQDILNDLLPEFNISDYLLESVNDWIAYKKERNFSYKERGMRTLLKTIYDKSRQFGDQAVVNAINESITSGYQGIVWDKIAKVQNFGVNQNILDKWRNA